MKPGAASYLCIPLSIVGAMHQCMAGEPTRTITSPVLGFVAGRNVLRPINGVPGAAWLGASIQLDEAVDKVVPAAASSHALAITGPDRRLVLLRDITAAPVVEAVPGVAGRIADVALSPQGFAAVAATEGTALVVIAGLPHDPHVAWTFDLARVAGTRGMLAVSDDSTRVLAATRLADREAVYVIEEGGAYHQVAALARSSGASFLTGSRGAVLLDGAERSLYMVQAGDDVPWSRLISSPVEDLLEPLAAAVSGDGKSVVVADAQANGVYVIPFEGGPPQLLPCPCRVRVLERLRGNAVFRISEAGEGPVWLFDGDSAPARIVFVPRPDEDGGVESEEPAGGPR